MRTLFQNIFEMLWVKDTLDLFDENQTNVFY